MAKIYVASSWRNNFQETVVDELRKQGHEVYDFKNPPNGEKGFGWSQIDPDWKNWTPAQFVDAMSHPIARKGYRNDKDGMDWCTHCVLLLPSGRSAHLEAGWCAGRDKPTAVFMPQLPEPELMYKLLEDVRDTEFPFHLTLGEVFDWLERTSRPRLFLRRDS
jgi:hypothetical protein